MAATGTSTLRICGDGHANAIAVNRDFNHLAIAGRSRKDAKNIYSVSIFEDGVGAHESQMLTHTLHTCTFSSESLFNRTRGIH